MSAFIVSFTATVNTSGSPITFTDTSNYGVGGSYNKINFTNRQLLVTRGDNPNNTVTYAFPYTNSNNATQDTFTLDITQDYSYSVTLEMYYTPESNEYSWNSPVITEQFIRLALLAMMAMIKPCDCNDFGLLDSIIKINAALTSAEQRTSAGDIQGGQAQLYYAYDETLLYVNSQNTNNQ